MKFMVHLGCCCNPLSEDVSCLSHVSCMLLIVCTRCRTRSEHFGMLTLVVIAADGLHKSAAPACMQHLAHGICQVWLHMVCGVVIVPVGASG